MRQETKMLCLVAVLSLMPPAVHAQPEGAARWAPTGALIEGRQHHTATLLSSGQVLVAGGKREDLILPNAELYDPMTGEWTPTGSLKVARDRHTATLLPDGRVLVTGGEAFNEDYGFNLATAAVEIYDPATGRWSMANDLEITRAEHTATLLDSGKVLIVGGLSVEELVSASAELYDVAIGVSEAAGSFSERRWGHTATLLPSGKVLVVGGNRGVSVASAALYDPRTREWSPAGELALARTYHSATLLPDGKVLVAGGNQSSAVDGMLVTTFPTPAELYDPEEGTWTTTGSLHFARARHSAVLLPSGKVLAAGGQSGDFPWRETELYDPRTGEWTLDAPLAVNRRLHTSTLLPSGQVLAIGGEGVIENGLTSAEVYTPRSGVWSQTAAFPEPIAAHTATLLPSGDVLVAGGGEVRGSVDATPIALESLFNLIVPGDAAGLYRAGTSTWQPLARLGEARTGHSATLLPSGDVLVAAGLGKERFLASAEIFRSAEETWVPAAPLRTRRAAHTATLLASGEVVVAGGVNEEALAPETLTRALASADRYDPTRDHWTRTGDMLLARLGHTATLLPSGKVLVSGGWSENQYALESEVYDPSSGVWTETGRLNAGRLFHTATLLPSGKVLVAGGLPATNVELFDPESGTWTDLGDLDRTRTSNTATLLADGRLMVTGGTAIVDEITLSTLDAVDVYDPAPRAWRKEPRLTTPRALHTATVLADGGVLVVGGGQASTTLASAEIYRPEVDPTRRRPLILHHSPQVRHGRNLTVTGTGLRGDSAASQGNARDSAVDLPLVQLRSLEDERLFWLAPARGAWPDFSGETATLRVRELPADLQPGWHALTVYAAGLPSETRFVEVGCGLAVDAPPRDATAAIGATATFTVRTRGARSLQWQKDGFDIPGATAASYTTPPITAADAGASYRVRLANGCTTRTSPSAKLLVEDHEPPAAGVLYPRGGEIWLLSTPEQPNVQVVSWEMSDNVRICQVTASLVFSNDGGDTWESGPSVTYGPGGACAHPGEGRTSVTYPVPGVPPSGRTGSLYKVRLRVTDHAGLVTVAESEKPFSIVRPNNESVRTLIVTHLGRLGALGNTQELRSKLEELADHPQVQGVVVDLDDSPEVNELYDLWDADARSAEPDPARANLVLFGCHEPLPEGCPGERDGVHDAVRGRLAAYLKVEHLVLVGDDRIVPFARVTDRTVLLPESSYASDDPADLNAGLTASGTTVGQALAADHYLSDDPLARVDVVRPEELREKDRVFLPELRVGRLVESPEEIVGTVAAFLRQDGLLDLTEADPEDGSKVMVSAYDFLIDSGRNVRDRWTDALGSSVDGELVSATWDADSVEERREALRAHLGGNGGLPSLILNPNGHATHYELGVPGLDRFDVQGLPAESIDADLAGRVVYAVGCHGGLVVAGGSAADRLVDLPQRMMDLGVQAYVANTGYGWGLLHGVGLSERLVEIFTDELTAGGAVRVGEAVRQAKRRYFSETTLVNAYDAKTLMQWTLYGLPMYSIRTGIAARTDEERQGIVVERQLFGGEHAKGLSDLSLPRFLTRLELRFDFESVYENFDADGMPVSEPGCPAEVGCYYRLNGLATWTPDLPIQPFFVYDSRLAGTHEHGVLWMGGTFTQEDDWKPVFAELVSNGGDGSDHGSTPRQIFVRPRRPRPRPLDDGPSCRPSDPELNSVVVVTGEALKPNDDDPDYSVQRLHRQVWLETLYFNNTETGEGNCDEAGPAFSDGPYHEVRGTSLEWSVPVQDEAGVWRVVAVVSDGRIGADGRGRWTPVELVDDGNGRFRGSVPADGATRLTYYLQAVDRRGNVSWLEYERTEVPASGLEPGIPRPIDVEFPEDGSSGG